VSVGLIGDDIEAVAKEKGKELGKPVVPVRCEGFRGVSQSLGHHIANDVIRDWVLDKEKDEPAFVPGPYDVVVIGDYNIGGDAWSSRKLLEEMGLRVIAQWTGDSTHRRVGAGAQGQAQPDPLLPLDELHLPAHGREVRDPWMEFNFFGPSRIEMSLRAIAEHFDDTIKEGAEAVIAKYKPMADGGDRQVPPSPRRTRR
jgi:nitrogenase molybdenum-iron protein alpha chain